MRSSMATTMRRPRTSPIPMICPLSIVANRRSLDTRIVVTRGSGSFSRAGKGLLRAASGLSAGTAGVFRPLDAGGLETSGFAVGAGGAGVVRLSGRVGFDSGFCAGRLTTGGFDFGFDSGFGFDAALFAASLTSPRDSGDFAGTLGAGAADFAFTTGVFGLAAGGAVTTGGFDFGFDSGFFAGTLTAPLDSGDFAGTLGAGASTLGAPLDSGDFGFDSGFFGFDSALFAESLTAGGFDAGAPVTRATIAETAGSFARMYQA